MKDKAEDIEVSESIDLVERCLVGDAQAIVEFRREFSELLKVVLIGRGASVTEAGDIVGDLLSDCVGDIRSKQSLLTKFHHKISLRAWLVTVATNRLIDFKRRQRFIGDPDGEAIGGSERREVGFIERVGVEEEHRLGDDLVELMESALRAALKSCPDDCRLMLTLVYIDGVSQRTVARMWHWHESKISRYMHQGMQAIAENTLAEIRKRDPWLTLTWKDFVELCQSTGTGFFR